MPGALSLFIFLAALLGLYYITFREEEKYKPVENSLEGEETEKSHRACIWEGDRDNYHIRVIRGMDFRDSNRMITIQIESPVDFKVRLDPENYLRKFFRNIAEAVNDRQQIKFEGPLSKQMIYSNEPDLAKQALTSWNTPESVENIAPFHNIQIDEEYVSGAFYQLEVDIEEIKKKTDLLLSLVRLLEKNSEIQEATTKQGSKS